MATGDQFEKDFGYLMPFLQKVAEAAAELSDPAAREELTRLIAGEQHRWLRIRELLGGARGTSPAPSPATPPRSLASPPASTGGAWLQGAPAPVGFTVGTLRRG